ncbi:MAG: sigma-70 family RNA polymerase sigma factor [Bacilli bacterium]|nr:sigma-70 family RNA polymerase sigma factor [Bacilli bacterium]
MEELLDYDGLLYSIINKYSKRYDYDDLYQVAMLGLIDAYKHYDKSFDTKFSTYAYYYIIGEINKYIRESSSLKVSKSLIDLNKNILKTKEVMTQKLGRVPTKSEIALYLDVEEDLIDTAILATDEIKSLDEIYDNTKFYDDTSPTILDLRSEIEKLSPEEQELLKMRYYEEYTQMETSSILGMSQVQVSRKENKVLQKLKSRLVS